MLRVIRLITIRVISLYIISVLKNTARRSYNVFVSNQGPTTNVKEDTIRIFALCDFTGRGALQALSECAGALLGWNCSNVVLFFQIGQNFARNQLVASPRS